jgi:CheY-like chemotaxis protein
MKGRRRKREFVVTRRIVAVSLAGRRIASGLLNMSMSESAAEVSAPREIDLDGGLLEGIRILVVEDDGRCREALAIALEAQGAAVTAAASVSEALECIDAEVPQIVLSDIEMPEQDGFALIRQVRDLDRRLGTRTPSIAVTGYAARGAAGRILAAGFDDYVAKPVDLDALASRIRVLARIL